MSYPTLDDIVLQTLAMYSDTGTPLPRLDVSTYTSPLVVGSGNGFYTGRILFRRVGAYYANESDVSEKLQIPGISQVVVISASGEKHAPIILQKAKDIGKDTLLISSNVHSSARDIAHTSIVMPRIREPYTYNTSTYFGYMLAETPDLDVADISQSLQHILAPILQQVDWTAYTGFVVVLPDRYVLLREMVETKFIELFGRVIGRDVFTYEQMKHATTVVPSDELFICFGNDTGIVYGENQINLPVYDVDSYAAMMMYSYYMVGYIQRAFPTYFSENIDTYCQHAYTQSGFRISPWVEV